MESLTICPMEYFAERTGSLNGCIKIADKLLDDRIWLHRDIYYKPAVENIFDTVFDFDVNVNREYLLSMDYLSALLTVYRELKEERHKEKFLEIVGQFFDYFERGMFSPTKDDDLIICAQTLMFVKSFSIIDYEKSLNAKIIDLLYKYAVYCHNDENYNDENNHGLFTDLALLHLSVLFGTLFEAEEWRKHAMKRVLKFFDATFYKDGFNIEGSLSYFRLNLLQYRTIVKFCNAYNISGVGALEKKIENAEQIFYSFARKDGSFPMIGDGTEIVLKEYNDISALYPDAGICVVKMGEMYLTFKCKGIMQAHTHVDDMSITARFQTFDLALDSGQYNYDRYHPVNRYLRTSGGHSGIFPLFADGLGLREYLGRRNFGGVNKFELNKETCLISGGYELDGGEIKVYRDITVKPECIEVRDSWTCSRPQNMRQRFILPAKFLDKSRYTASKSIFETSAEEYDIRYEIKAGGKVSAVTTMNFGVLSKKYGEMESTVLLDTTAECSMRGEITALITVERAENKKMENLPDEY